MGVPPWAAPVWGKAFHSRRRKARTSRRPSNCGQGFLILKNATRPKALASGLRGSPSQRELPSLLQQVVRDLREFSGHHHDRLLFSLLLREALVVLRDAAFRAATHVRPSRLAQQPAGQ